MALAAGVLIVGGLIATLGSEPPPTPPPPTRVPGSASLGLFTPEPTIPPEPTPTLTMPGSPSVPIGTQVGNMAPRLVLPHVAGGEIDTATAIGTPLWINFMATWCPPCREELPMMQRIQLQAGDELEIVLVDVGEDEDVVFDFLVDLGVDLPTGLDTDSQAQQAWGAFALPLHYFIDAEGIVQEVVIGGAPREVFVEALAKIAPDVEVDIDDDEPTEEPSETP